MTSKGRQKKLAQFGATVLAILEETEDWSASTFDYIADEAQDKGLATCEAGMFVRTEEGKL